MKWARNIARIDEMRNAYTILVEDLNGRDHSEDLGVDVRLILKFDLGK
jgi:hypothetical protein